jgi:hypothetical protein
LSAAPNSQTASSNESEPQLVGSTSATGPNHGKDDSEVEGFEREDTSPGPPWMASNQQVLQEALARDRTSREPPRWRTRNLLTCGRHVHSTVDISRTSFSVMQLSVVIILYPYLKSLRI